MNSEPTTPVRSGDNVAGLSSVSHRKRNGKSRAAYSRRKKRHDHDGEGRDDQLPPGQDAPVGPEKAPDENEDTHLVDYLA